MKAQTLSIIVVAAAILFLAGCTEFHSDAGTHVYHHSSPSTGQALQATGTLLYESVGRKNGVTPQEYNRNMRGMGALGTILDYSY